MNARQAREKSRQLVSIAALSGGIVHDYHSLLTTIIGNISLFSDHGRGIPAKDLSKIFTPYFSTKKDAAQKGCGLGLSICHSIVILHEGDLQVESKPGRGTTVHFYLPAATGKTLEENLTNRQEQEIPLRFF